MGADWRERGPSWQEQDEPGGEWFFQIFDALAAVASLVRGYRRPR
jgi:hypothetical protein